MPIKTFRGLIADGGQDTVVLHTNDGSMGYRIVKFEIMSNTPVTVGTQESVVQIWKTQQAAPSTSTIAIDFSNQILLATAIWASSDDPRYQSDMKVFFDKEIFNQDVYITHTNTDGSASINYYLELEQIKLDLNENTVATLKDIRNQA